MTAAAPAASPPDAGYHTKLERVAVRGADSLVIRSLLDRQQYADPCGEAAAAGFSSATWSLFGVVWPSALQLAALMAVWPLARDQRILEVGCGLALASLVCHRRRADVTASDSHPLAPCFLLDNAGLNDLPPLPYRHGDWGADPRQLVHDRHPVVRGHFDLIMGSDVLYERDDPGHLAAFIGRHAAPGAQVLIVDPDRRNRPAFARRMAADGFALRETPLCGRDGDALPYKGRLMHFSRSRGG
ncbi:MAG TPA: methyltransferase domain-containing protein [Burkholderiaceae bacterium]|nr:methyltransferase domain-containing protein [Burkholderiaceae bacterium]